jgi:hypothetical protein
MKIHNSRSIANRMRRQGESWALVNVTILARKYHLLHFLMNTTLLGVVYRSTTHIVLCLSLSCVPYIASFSGLSIFDGPFGIL